MTYQIYTCGHQNCGVLLVKAERRWPHMPYCPTRYEREPEAAHPLMYQGQVDEQTVNDSKHMDTYVRYTHRNYDGTVCCEFICLGCSEVYCPNCGEVVRDAYRQQVDPKRVVVRTEVA